MPRWECLSLLPEHPRLLGPAVGALRPRWASHSWRAALSPGLPACRGTQRGPMPEEVGFTKGTACCTYSLQKAYYVLCL